MVFENPLIEGELINATLQLSSMPSVKEMMIAWLNIMKNLKMKMLKISRNLLVKKLGIF